MLTIRSEPPIRPAHLNAQASSGQPSRPSLLRRMGRAIWRSLEQAGQKRARRHLSLLADHHQHCNPSYAAELRAASRFDAGSDGSGDAKAPTTSAATPAGGS